MNQSKATGERTSWVSSQEFQEASFEAYSDSLHLCKDVLKQVPEGWKGSTPVIPMLLQSYAASLESFMILHGLKRYQDAFILSRPLLEGAVNMCYLAAQGHDAQETALKHAAQKAFRDMNREIETVPLEMKMWRSGIEETEVPDDFRAIVDEFTTSKGREDMRWTKTSIDDRINMASEVLGGFVGRRLAFGRFIIYRHSSELIHSTFFGALFSSGIDEAMVAERPTIEDIKLTKIERTVLLGTLLTPLTVCALSAINHESPTFATALDKSKKIESGLLATMQKHGSTKSEVTT